MTNLMNSETITINSAESVTTTTDRLENALRAKGFSIFLRLDQQAEAEKTGMKMPGTEVIIFGKPEAGTQLMNDYPSIALELPLKLIIQQDDVQTSTVRLNSPQYIAKRHGVKQQIFNGLESLLRQSVNGS